MGGHFIWRPHQAEKLGGLTSDFPCVGVRLVYKIGHSDVRLLLCFVSIGPCCWYFLSTFLPPLPFTDLSSHNPPILAVAFRVFCNNCASLSWIFLGHFSYFIMTMCPAHFIRLLTLLPTMQALVPTSSRRSFILRLSTLHTPAILLIQLFSHILYKFVLMRFGHN